MFSISKYKLYLCSAPKLAEPNFFPPSPNKAYVTSHAYSIYAFRLLKILSNPGLIEIIIHEYGIADLEIETQPLSRSRKRFMCVCVSVMKIPGRQIPKIITLFVKNCFPSSVSIVNFYSGVGQCKHSFKKHDITYFAVH